MPGKFITFEGGEGCGKSTQIRLLQAALERCGKRVLLTREPGGTPLNERLRPLIKEELEDPPVDKCELLLFLAARAQLVEKVIRPRLEAGEWVICDRFGDSTLAYQGYGRGMDLATVGELNRFACGTLKPDLTLLLDLPLEVANARRRARETGTGTVADRIELAGGGFHERIRNGFLELQRLEPERIRLIDASGTPEEVFARVWKSISPIV